MLSHAPLRRLALQPIVALAFSLGALAAPVLAEDAYPTKAIQVVVPYPAGGPADVMARILADRLSASFKQPIVVMNRPGAGGNIGGKAVAVAEPDGYTLLFTVDASLTANPALYGPQMGFDPLKDLRAVSTVVTFGATLAVNPSLKVGSVGQFVELAGKQPLNYASAGNGSTGQLNMELFTDLARIKVTHIPYKGAAPALNDMVGGQVASGFLVTPGVAPFVKAGKLMALAVSSEKRSRLLPDVPTIAEAGYPGATLEFGMVLLAPARTPEPIMRKLQEETRQAMASPEVRKMTDANDYTVVSDSSAQAASRLAATTQKLGTLIKTLGITAE